MHIHKWGQWEQVEMTHSRIVSGKVIERDVTRQMRRCSRCGKTEIAAL